MSLKLKEEQLKKRRKLEQQLRDKFLIEGMVNELYEEEQR